MCGPPAAVEAVNHACWPSSTPALDQGPAGRAAARFDRERGSFLGTTLVTKCLTLGFFWPLKRFFSLWNNLGKTQAVVNFSRLCVGRLFLGGGSRGRDIGRLQGSPW